MPHGRTSSPMQASVEDRLRGVVGATIIVALLASILLLGLTIGHKLREQPRIVLLGLREPVPAKPPIQPRVERPRRSHASGRASAPNLRARATPIVAPKPVVVPLVRPPVVAALKAGAGTATASGSSDVSGAGEGAGGRGDGTGAGDRGDGDGVGGGDIPPRQIKGRLQFTDLPRDLRDRGTGGSVIVRYDVDATGRVSDCAVTASSGSSELDELTCALIQRRFRFEPSRNAAGEPIAATIEERHRWEFERPVDPVLDR